MGTSGLASTMEREEMGIINGAVWLAHVCVACTRFYYDYYLRFVFGIKYVAVNYVTYCEPKPKSIEQVNAMTIYCCHRHRHRCRSRETTTRTTTTTEAHTSLRHAILCLLGACRLLLVHLLRFYYYSCRIFAAAAAAAAAATNRANEWKNLFFFVILGMILGLCRTTVRSRRIRVI